MAYLNDDLVTSVSGTSRRDLRGCAVSTGSATAVAQVEQALESMLSYFGDPFVALERAIEADPDWAHAHTLKAALLLTAGEHGRERQRHARGMQPPARKRHAPHGTLRRERVAACVFTPAL